MHSHEEGSFIGVLVAGLLRVPHLYDMHSSLPQQLTNFAFSQSRALARFFAWMERFVIRRSKVVIVICPQLEEVVRGIEPGVPAVLIENAPGSGDTPVAGSGARVRSELGLAADAPVVLYTGTFEAYQGLDLLFAAGRQVLAARPDARFVLAGGRPDQVAAARLDAERAGLGAAVVFAGQRPAEEIPLFLDAADVLVSPRSTGTNTPLKIYQYLRSGRPIVATRLLTHTQVLDDDVAILTAPTPEGFAGGILAAIAEPARARDIGCRARQLAETKYSVRGVPGAHAAGLRAPRARARAADRRRRRVSGAAPSPDHYSYSVYADPAMAEAFDTMRFGGPIGRLLAESQERVIASFLAPLTGRTILDVGTGTGRAALALAVRGAAVTGVDASAEMLAVAERRAKSAGIAVTFARGDAHGLEFPPQSFDAVTCLRVLMHTPDWRRSLGELCRVARERVVFDYPALSSAAALQAVTRHVAHALGARVEAYRVFSDRAVRATLAAHGFRIVRIHRQFVLPIALHKMINSVPLTNGVEGLCATLGLTRLVGSPVTVAAERCAS